MIMRIILLTLLLFFTSTIVTYADTNTTQNMKGDETLTPQQQTIIPISAFCANGDIERLKPALVTGLESGLSVNEIKEILIQLYAYAGFPRSLNAINAFMAVMQEREAKGIKDSLGKEASPLPKDMDKDAYGAKVRQELAGWKEEPKAQGYQLFTPVMDTYLKEHLFADIFARDVLSHQERELVTISALAAMNGTEGQLMFHLGAAMNSGLTIPQMHAFIAVLEGQVGQHEANTANLVLSEVLKKRK
jgi:alkylhydroperoxidase/carboxymuconolactone decarboxylase family protein YurZ